MISKLITAILMSASVITPPTFTNKEYKATEEREEQRTSITITNFDYQRTNETIESTNYSTAYYREYFYKKTEQNIYNADILIFSNTANRHTYATNKWALNNTTYFIFRSQTTTDINYVYNRFWGRLTKSLNISVVGTGLSVGTTYKQPNKDEYTIDYYLATTTSADLQNMYNTKNYSDIASLAITTNVVNEVIKDTSHTGQYNAATLLQQENNITSTQKNTFIVKATTRNIPRYINDEYVDTESQENLAVKTNVNAVYIENLIQWIKPTTTNGNYTMEVIDLPTLMLTILSLPFNFLSTAFNVTIFEGTPYAINFANIFKGLIAILALLFIVKLFTRGLDAIGNTKDKNNNKPNNDEKPKKQDKGE